MNTTSLPSTTDWIKAVRASHDRLAGLLTPLSVEQVHGPAYPTQWSIADTASHLGSQGEIFHQFLSAGLAGAEPPGTDVFAPIWDRWNGLPPAEQVSESIIANESFVAQLEQVSPEQQDTFGLSMFGRDFDLAQMASMRLGEHALHTWDIEVALDPSATIGASAVDLMIDTVGQTASRAGKPDSGIGPITVETTSPQRRFLLTVADSVTLESDAPPAEDPLALPAEPFLRLVTGRLDHDHTPTGIVDPRVDQLRAVFTGF